MNIEATKAQTKKVGSRFGGWLVGSLVALIFIMVRAPQQGEIIVYKLLLVFISVPVCYMVDRSLYRNAPGIDIGHERDNVSAARLIARALVSFAIIYGITSGL
jgi:hypothetical protein